MTVAGYGITPYGRCNCGQADNRFEPRFYQSDPVDEASDISIYKQPIYFTLYAFSSFIDPESVTKIRVSEDGGGSYSDAYVGGSFVAPYDGAYSRMYKVDGQTLKVFVHKTGLWPIDEEIRVEVTAVDEYGDEATDESPVIW